MALERNKTDQNPEEIDGNLANGVGDDSASVAAAPAVLCSERHLLNCQFGEWYPKFSQRTNSGRPRLTPRSIVLQLCGEIVNYLSEGDSVVLPAGFELSCANRGPRAESDDGWSSDDNDGTGNSEDGSGNDPENGEGSPSSAKAAVPSGPAFAALASEMASAIAELGGRVFPKLNWSSPKDAAWVNGGSLCCRSPGDVMCLLKSSLFASHDLHHAYECCEEGTAATRPPCVTLVLRRWCELSPARQLRCFVRNRRLIGISQRDCSARYPHLEADAPALGNRVAEFLAREVGESFPDPDYVADVYVDRHDEVWLIDFNVFASVTDSLLFSWEELTADEDRDRAGHESLGDEAVSARQLNGHGHMNGYGSDTDDHTGPLPAAGAMAAAAGSAELESDPDFGAEEAEAAGAPQSSVIAAAASPASASAAVANVDFRFVTEDLPLAAGPMARYRGPADVELLAGGASGLNGGFGGGGEGGGGGSMDFEALLARFGGLER